MRRILILGEKISAGQPAVILSHAEPKPGGAPHPLGELRTGGVASCWGRSGRGTGPQCQLGNGRRGHTRSINKNGGSSGGTATPSNLRQISKWNTESEAATTTECIGFLPGQHRVPTVWQ